MKSILNSKPFKSLPAKIIYKSPFKGSYMYTMADTKQKKVVGHMIGNMCTETMCSNYYPSFSSYDSFKVHYLIINQDAKKQGNGKAFINLAKNISRQNGGKGRVHLEASSIFDPHNPPHPFYRKLGFTSNFEKVIKYIDKCIKKNKPINPQKVIDIPMYLCPKTKIPQPQPKQTFLQRIKSLIKAL